MKISIARPKAPETVLYVEIVSEQKDKLGEKKPVAFVLPGGPGADHRGYMSYTCLKDKVDLVFHDPRGCGQSERGDVSSYTMNNYIDDVEAIRQALSLNNIFVIGKSYGAMCALGYTLRYPHAVEKLVLSAGAPSYHFLETAKKNVKCLGTPEQIEVCERLWQGAFKSNEELLQYFQLTQPLYSVKARANPPTNLSQKIKQFSFEVLNQGFKHELWHFDYEQVLQTISCPTLILAGREDWITDVSYSEAMMKKIPNSQLHIFDKASHAMEVDVTETYFQTIANFIV